MSGDTGALEYVLLPLFVLQFTMCTLGSSILLWTKFPCSSHWGIVDTPVVDTGEKSKSLVFTHGSWHKTQKSCSCYRGIFYSPVVTTGEYLRKYHKFRV